MYLRETHMLEIPISDAQFASAGWPSGLVANYDLNIRAFD